ncbi:Csu type fimbrial protein [Neisseria dentiae]|uniref:Csu type fimbrial protein n=1 Tax=Neisseria dentiae TaxID=194197 RepID=UPI00211C6E90|nr:spore coat U domain-containing protein [Neisseria dentiae]MCQ9326788.1 spore coat U domain-containing protein [Neisseria dentiae]
MHKINPPGRPFSVRPAKQRILFIARLLVVACLLLFVQTARAECTAAMQPVNFGNVDLLNPGTLATQATVTVTCTKSVASGTAQAFQVCLAADGSRANTTQLNPRYMCPSGVSCTTANQFAYNMYIDASRSTIWGTISRGSQYRDMLNTSVSFSATEAANTTRSVNLTVYARLITPLSNVPPGRYTASFADGSTAVAFGTGSSCGSLLTATRFRFPFTVSATVVKNCNVNKPNNIDFGTVNPGDSNLAGSTSLDVTCTSGTPYNIGLKPSNNNTAGAGEMLPVTPGGGNTDRIPYQLRSGSGANGAVWGNTATATQTGNGVGGTGTGSLQNYNIYATVPSADYHYGDYQDTVTVQVNY